MKNRVLKFRFEQMSQGNTHRLYIYDNVSAYGDFNWETWEYEESETGANYFREQLNGIPDTDNIELHVNSYGGDVKEGIAIYNLLKQHKAEKICYVDGFAYSIASVICMACDKIIMGLGTSMLVHNMAANVYGNADTLRKWADDLDVLMESNRKIYMERAKNLTEDSLKEMMDKETYLTPEQCMEYGFCDEIGTAGADQTQLNQQMAAQLMQLQGQIREMKSFREEMKMIVPEKSNPLELKNPEQEKPDNNQKIIKMMNSFLKGFKQED